MKINDPLLIDFLNENGLDECYYDQVISRYFFIIDDTITDQDIKKDISSARKSDFSPKCYFLDDHEFKFINSNLFREHKILPIDGASVMSVLCLELQDEDLILDLCCSPGAKLSVISTLIKRGKGSVTGVDNSKKRLEICRSLCKKFKLFNVRLFNIDGTKFDSPPHLLLSPPAKPFKYPIDKKPFYSSSIFRKHPGYLSEKCLYDKVLVDVPCTNDGSIKMMKEKYKCYWKFNSYEDCTREFLEELKILQYKLLERGFFLLKSGGILIYSTCSLSQEQNFDIVKKFVGNYYNEVIQLNFPETIHEKLRDKNNILILPNDFGFGALYIARFSKK
jgi:16S rRNA C967 or C1407 C5-methylase (RsmB/RsmF family)